MEADLGKVAARLTRRALGVFTTMNSEAEKAISNLEAISSVEDPDELQKLDDSIQQLLACENTELGIDALLRVFERFPDKDAYGIFWSIVHGLESLPDYEEKLVESVRRQPSRFGVLMVDRMLNAGMTQVNGINLLDILKNVAADGRQSEEIRSAAQEDVERHESES